MRIILLLGLLWILHPACAQQKTEMTMSDTAIFKAAATNDTNALKAAITSGASPEIKDGQGRTPLMVATYSHHTAAAALLIAAGANVNAQDQLLNSPFLYAGAEGYADIVKLCMAAGANYQVYNRYGGSALIPACERAHIDVIRLLLADKNFPIDHINRLGWTALLEAVILGRGGAEHQEVVRLLIAAGAKLNIGDKEGVTALQHAKSRGYKAIVKMLEQAGAK